MQPHVPDLPRVEESVVLTACHNQCNNSKTVKTVKTDRRIWTWIKKLSDDEVVKQFRGRSLSQKPGIFKRVFRALSPPLHLSGALRPDLRLAYVIVKLGTHSGLTQLDSWLKLQLSKAYRRWSVGSGLGDNNPTFNIHLMVKMNKTIYKTTIFKGF
jgi:hypothetical protein